MAAEQHAVEDLPVNQGSGFRWRRRERAEDGRRWRDASGVGEATAGGGNQSARQAARGKQRKAAAASAREATGKGSVGETGAEGLAGEARPTVWVGGGGDGAEDDRDARGGGRRNQSGGQSGKVEWEIIL